MPRIADLRVEDRDPHVTSMMERAIRFYRDKIGVELERDGPVWTTFRDPGRARSHCTRSKVASRGPVEPDPTFIVDDAAVERTRLLAAGVDVSEIHEPAAGVRVFDARDPDGNRISLEARAATVPGQ